MAFKVFDAYGAASRPEATLRSSGYIFLSKGILRRAERLEATHAQLLYDETDNRLGIRLHTRPEAPKDGTARELSLEKSGVSLNLLPLFRFYGFPNLKDKGKRVLPVTFEGRLIVVDLASLRAGASAEKPGPNAGASAVNAGPRAEESDEFDDDIPF